MERRPALTLLIAIVTLIIGPGIHSYTLAIAIGLLLAGPVALGKLAEYDPQFEDVILRYAAYDRIYDAESPLGVHESLWFQLGELTNTIPKPLAGARRPAVPTPGEI
jgi:hypothetical protein